MARVLFVTGSAGLVGYLQHRSTLRKSIGGSGNVLGTFSRRSVEMIAATILRNLVRFRLKTRHNRPRNLRLPALPVRENQNRYRDTQSPWAPEGLPSSVCTNRM
jgi:hypothetical protein